jgi:hypothetical protein
MDLFRNKSSGKIFIHIDVENESTALMVTPEGKVKPLELRFFEFWGSVDPDNPPVNLLTKAQMHKYMEYAETFPSGID